MFLAGTIVLIVGIVIFSRIQHEVLDAKVQVAVAEAESGGGKAKGELDSLPVGDGATVRLALQRTLQEITKSSGKAGEYTVALEYQLGDATNVATTQPLLDEAIPADMRTVVSGGIEAYKYALSPRSDISQTPTLYVGIPILSNKLGAERASLFYAFPLQQEQSMLSEVRTVVAISGVFLTIMMVAVALLITRFVVSPLHIVARTAGELTDGHLDKRVPVRGQDEIARLSKSFNAMAESLQRQILELERLSLMQQQFTSDVSHELRTPLTTIQMAADVLFEARDDFDGPLARSSELLHAELERFERLLADLLEISRFDAGVATLELEPVDVKQLLCSIIEDLEVLADRNGSSIEVGAPEVQIIANIDRRRVARIVRNLLGNAIEYGAGKPIHVGLSLDRATVRVTVSDSGVGLSDEEALRVFDRFWRADPSRVRTIGGSGLGLAISLEDAILHGGELNVLPGGGTDGATFELSLPLRAGH